MSKFKVGDKVKRTGNLNGNTWLDFLASGYSPNDTFEVTFVDEYGNINVENYISCYDESDLAPFADKQFEVMEELPEAPESSLYFTEQCQGTRLTVERSLMYNDVYNLTVHDIDDRRLSTVSLSWESLLQLSHDLLRMGLKLKREQESS